MVCVFFCPFWSEVNFCKLGIADLRTYWAKRNSDSEEIEQTWTEGSIVKLSERGANPRYLPNNTKSWRLEVCWKINFKLDENGLLMDFVFHFYTHLTRASSVLCLDLFALNVPTCFAFRFTIFGKSTPHFAHRSLPQGAWVI